MKCHNKRELSNYLIEHAYNTGYHHTESEKNNKPRKSLSHTLYKRLLKILFRGKTGQLSIILTHLIIHNFDDALGCDDSQNFVHIVKYRYITLRIILQSLDTVIYGFVSIYIRE